MTTQSIPAARHGDIEFPQLTLTNDRTYDGKRRLRYEATAERMAPNGLKITRHFSEEHHFDVDSGEQVFTGRSAYDRTESFVARIVRDITLIGSRQVCAYKGGDVVLWRIEDLYKEGWTDGRQSVRYRGYANNGRQSISFDSDAEAQHHVASLRNADGKVLRAADWKHGEKAAQNYSYLMSY